MDINKYKNYGVFRRACFTAVTYLGDTFIVTWVLAAPLNAFEVSTTLNSKYVTEGRDQLGAGGILWLSGSHYLTESLSISADYGYATSHEINYDELNLLLTFEGGYSGISYAIAFQSLDFDGICKYSECLLALYRRCNSLA